MKMIVIGSIAISILASILFYGQNLGISVILFVVALLSTLCYFLEKRGKIKNRKAYFLGIPIILLSSTYFIYNQPFFQAVNMIAIVILTAIMLIWLLLETTETQYLIRRIVVLLLKPFGYVSEALRGISHALFPQKKEVKKENKHLKQIWIGIGISLPILIVVLLLLSSADMIFAQGIKNITGGIFEGLEKIFSSNFLANLLGRIILIVIMAVYMVSFILNLWNRKLLAKPENAKQIKISVETTIFNTLVTILNIVYAIFCTIQITSLFAKITPSDFDYAEYARQGFFQLMFVSAINFAIILINTMNKKQAIQRQMIYQKVMNIFLTLFTIIILMSALTRMNLYQQEYGYTYLRIFVDFALITEAILLIPTIIYIIKPNFNPLKSYLAIIITMYVIMNFSNIGNFIAKENVNRYLQNEKDFRRGIDFYYLIKTGTDGLEEVMRLYQNEQEGSRLKRQIESYFEDLKISLQESTNFQEFNISKWKAQKLLKQFEIEK